MSDPILGGSTAKTRVIAGVIAGAALVGAALYFLYPKFKGDEVVAATTTEDDAATDDKATATDDGKAAEATEKKETVSLPCYATGAGVRCTGPRPDGISGTIVRQKDWTAGGKAYVTLVNAENKPVFRSTEAVTIPDATVTEEASLGNVEFAAVTE